MIDIIKTRKAKINLFSPFTLARASQTMLNNEGKFQPENLKAMVSSKLKRLVLRHNR